MNAGAMGAQTFDNVVRVRYLDAEGERARENAGGTGSALSARSDRWKQLCRLGGFSRRRQHPTEEIVRRLEESQEKRRTTQPRGQERRLHFQESGQHVRRENWSTNWV